MISFKVTTALPTESPEGKSILLHTIIKCNTSIYDMTEKNPLQIWTANVCLKMSPLTQTIKKVNSINKNVYALFARLLRIYF